MARGGELRRVQLNLLFSARYPIEFTPNENKKKKMKGWPRSKPRIERGFLEGCLFALCCC
ncbi:hypothetical protein RDI58_025398 [Solanum bulbocastanum]|uniref:Cysteine-rich transmembrane domain-containing protein n=1 Tax=Solanum bulbocastanum TaxID=147425 RepID=A0AAN8T1E3_SOLBU